MAASPPSPFFLAHLDALADAARAGPVADLACGRGRHALPSAERGVHVIGIDRNASYLAALRRAAAHRRALLEGVRANLEAPRGIPLCSGSCAAILVFRFLFRPLAPAIVETLQPGGLLLYETFTLDQLRLGYGPRNPAFLLEPGELRVLFPGLEILEYWEGMSAGDRPEALARLVARKRADL